MQSFLTVLKISLAIAAGWFAVVLWFLLLTVGASPLNQLLVYLGIVPLMTHSNFGGIIGIDHLSIMLQSILVFASGGFLTAFIAKDHELTACLILSMVVIATCSVWNLYLASRMYYSVDLFIWFDSFLIIMLSGFIVERKRLMKYYLQSILRRSK